MIHIDNETCKACDICGHVCPRHIIETIEREGEKVTLVSLSWSSVDRFDDIRISPFPVTSLIGL